MTAPPLYAAVVCASVALALVTAPAAGLLAAAVGFVGLWWLEQEVDDDDSP